jgi:hypothetical protein
MCSEAGNLMVLRDRSLSTALNISGASQNASMQVSAHAKYKMSPTAIFKKTQCTAR